MGNSIGSCIARKSLGQFMGIYTGESYVQCGWLIKKLPYGRILWMTCK